MQPPPSPARLALTIRAAFRAAKPVRVHLLPPPRPLQPWLQQRPLLPATVQRRLYSDNRSEVDKKVQDAKTRIDEALDARVEAASSPDTKLKDPNDETIIHTNPEASSIVYNDTKSSVHDTSSKPLPSQSSSQTSPIRQRFSHFMDNFQSHLFTASQRLNDLTGYSGIESLKKAIEQQEELVRTSRRAVKDARAQYAEAIATRSTTQREVNDLLHRKHTWSPSDLERFTNLYRSDHANEQVEATAQKDVGDAEAQYEENSTTLARTILARYHEEQIWSDKIRQMSTWGTWGLMGLNVLLFVVFQIAIEPWRRRRLVKGFEEKVELALRERGVDAVGAGHVSLSAHQDKTVDAAADSIAEQIVDAVSGTTTPSSDSTSIEDNPPTQRELELAAELSVLQDLNTNTSSLSPDFESTPPSTSTGHASYVETLRELLFSDKMLTLTQRELTAVVVEGAVAGAAVMGLLLVFLRPR